MHPTSHSDFYQLSAKSLRNALKKRDISSVELVQSTIERIEALDHKINAVVTRDFERALASAKAADKAIANNNDLPLLGLPITVKESYNVAGLATHWGNPDYKNWKPKEDALAVSRLKQAGAIILGKTNVPLMLRDWQTYNDLCGTTNNPWNLKLTSGGSSGGSASALIAGFTSLELGSDLAGSLRIPAHFCGVYTHKPTYDLIPVRGSAPPKIVPLPTGADLVTAGPLARNADDLLLAFDLLAGPDEILHGKGYKLNLPPPRHQNLLDFRVLFLDTHPLFPTSKSTQKALHELFLNLEKIGVKVSDDPKKTPCLKALTETYTRLLSALIGVNLPLDTYEHLKQLAKQEDPNDTTLSSLKLKGFSSSFRDYFLATRTRETLRLEWLQFFQQFDVIVCPVMPTSAFPHDHTELSNRVIEVDGKTYPYGNQFIWISLATALGFPATIVPIAETEDKLPIGVQIIGSYFEDYTTLKFAELLEKEFSLEAKVLHI